MTIVTLDNFEKEGATMKKGLILALALVLCLTTFA